MSHQLSRQASQQETRVLIPPRPNLGPERWSEEHSGALPFWSAGIALLVLLAGTIGIFWYRRRRSGRQATTPSPAEGLPPSHATELLNLACQIRDDLAARFGPSLRAQTTQEIAADLEVKEVLGVEHFELVIRLLTLADYYKFAALSENSDQQAIREAISAWKAVRNGLMARLAAKPQREAASP